MKTATKRAHAARKTVSASRPPAPANNLTHNEYGFDVATDNPFMIFPYLQQLARGRFEQSDIYDLSRGDPGLGFAPSERGRNLFGCLTIIDAALNSNRTKFRMHKATESELPNIQKTIEETARASFSPALSKECLAALKEVTEKIIAAASEEDKKLTELDVLKGIFNHSTLLGGSYHSPQGELLPRIAVASYYRQSLHEPAITSNDLVFTLGVNDAIGTLFKMLGAEGLGFLKPGDTIAASTPAYAPYLNEIRARKLNIVGLPILASVSSDFAEADAETERIKAFFLISPNNPTGAAYTREAIQHIAALAEKHDALIVSDEIYAPFFDDFTSPVRFAKKRTLRLCGRSKVERSPGLRFGDILIPSWTNDFLTDHLLKGYLTAPDFKTQFTWAKAPGGINGNFQHTATVPGPSQILGMLHVLLGEEERKQYLAMVHTNMEVFFKELGLPYHGEVYYGLFDLNDIPGCHTSNIHINQKLYDLTTKHGVIVIPAMQFFSPSAHAASDKSNYVRVSLPNLPSERVAEAARRIREYVTHKS
jgi:aspartate/methionine/tyrosine aminotransferase